MRQIKTVKSNAESIIERETQKGYTCIKQQDHFFTDEVVLSFVKSYGDYYVVEECDDIDELELVLNYYHDAGYQVRPTKLLK
ncbi:hypothetical protein IX317_000614 [Fusobacterium sp. DD29]|uniref:hypothetical protein n=1 Tax=unclassified Fusobacterium TaxID=2648384 RepID=UPI001B8B6886|nr:MULTISPECIES: hypothetical protein [unclassified Fusobacterium]MBR8700264.1 hypothetical protein [Fusobacterium sp. DD45]MBR8710481.1 hypothetical protein [Fusobacterium sp. DD28]MBR8748953.1 hypothetical protein [Fusobacterium sp. DD29]MBR8751069.1 hypothetical protein [Fusobacterium sp. DD26]MBR8761259.1 hypothetical protein [Fusobacterium sp. DD25]